MRIIVFSDTHGNFSAMHKIIKRNGDADLFMFLGDGATEFLNLKAHYLDTNMVWVKGNCDFAPDVAHSSIYELPDGRRIFYTHGDKWGVNWSLDRLFEKAKAERCDLVFYGHTHVRHAETREGILLLNPGSAGSPRDGLPACYAWVDVTDQGIAYNHVKL